MILEGATKQVINYYIYRTWSLCFTYIELQGKSKKNSKQGKSVAISSESDKEESNSGTYIYTYDNARINLMSFVIHAIFVKTVLHLNPLNYIDPASMCMDKCSFI